MRFSAASLSAAVIFSFFTSRSRLPVIVASPRSTAASATSTITTSMPDHRAGLRDAVAHGSGADDADFPDLAHGVFAKMNGKW